MKLLNEWIVRITEKLAFELQSSNKLTACIASKVKYSDFKTQTIQKRIPYTSFDHALIDEAQERLLKLYKPKSMVRLIVCD